MATRELCRFFGYPMTIPFPLLDLEKRFVGAARASLDIELVVSNDVDELLRVYDSAAQTGYRQFPFMREHWQDPRDEVAWVMAVHRGEPVGLIAGRRVFAHAEGDFVSDACAKGVLYRQSGDSADRGLIPGKGPRLPAPGLSQYQGCGWVHPVHRAKGLPGVLSRLCTMQALKAEPALEMHWGLENSRAALAGVMSRRSAAATSHVEEVFSGYHPGLRLEMKMCAIWAHRPHLLQVLQNDWQDLETTGRLAWLRAPAAAASTSCCA